jgi:hypothetical protein
MTQSGKCQLVCRAVKVCYCRHSNVSTTATGNGNTRGAWSGFFSGRFCADTVRIRLARGEIRKGLLVSFHWSGRGDEEGVVNW